MYFKGEVNQKTLLQRKSAGFDLVCTAESSKVLRCAVYQLPASPVEMARAEPFLENTLCHPECWLNGKGKHPVAHLMSLGSLLQD